MGGRQGEWRCSSPSPKGQGFHNPRHTSVTIFLYIYPYRRGDRNVGHAARERGLHLQPSLFAPQTPPQTLLLNACMQSVAMLAEAIAMGAMPPVNAVSTSGGSFSGLSGPVLDRGVCGVCFSI